MGHWKIIAINGKPNEKNRPRWGGYDWDDVYHERQTWLVTLW